MKLFCLSLGGSGGIAVKGMLTFPGTAVSAHAKAQG